MLPPNSLGISIKPEDICKVHFWYAVKKVGRGVLIKLFKWLTANLSSNIEGEILNYYDEKQQQNDYNEKYNCYFKDFTPQQWYEWEFLESERQVLNNRDWKPEDFTLSLLGKLFKKVCPLLRKNAKLRDMIHEIVCLQNTFAKEELEITEDELPTKLSDLETKLIEMLTEVSTLYNSILISIPDEKNEVKYQFTNLQTWLQEPFSDEDFEDFENDIKQLRKRLKQEVQGKCCQKLKIDYQGRCQDEPSPFFEVTGINHHKFTECHFIEQDTFQYSKDNKNKYLQKHLKKKYNYTNLRSLKSLELLQFPLQNNHLPSAILLHGDDDRGMSSLAQLYAWSWAQGKEDIAGLGHLNMVLYHDCGSHQASSLNDVLIDLLHNITVDIGIDVDHLLEILIQMDVLLILDKYGELENSTLFSDSLSIAGSMFRIFLTSSSISAKHLESQATETRKEVLELSYQGLSLKNQERFIKRILDVHVKNEFEKNEIFSSIVKNLSNLNDIMGECLQQSPHILSDLTQLLIEGENVTEMTSTQIFNKINESLQRKLVGTLLSSGVGMDVAEKCKIFYRYLCEIAYFSEFSHEIELEESTVHLLKEKCKMLKLPHNQVFSHYLILKRFRNDQSVDAHYSFPHESLKKSHASKHIAYLLQNDETTNFASSYEWCEKLHQTEYKSLLRNITGTLSILYPDVLIKYGKYILQIASKYNDNKYDNILCNVAESASNEECYSHMAKVASEIMSSSSDDRENKASDDKREKEAKLTWTIESNAALIPLTRVLKVKKPQLLSLENIKYSTFELFLPHISQRRMDVNVCMDVGFRDDQIYDRHSVKFHDEYLIQLTKSEHIFKVKWFSGCITESSISKLPQTLTRLKLNIATHLAPSLMNHVVQLQNLKYLEISLFGSFEPKLSGFSVDFPPRSKLRKLSFGITGVCSEDLCWFANLASICSPKSGALHTIKLHNTTATGKSICRMIEELQKNKTSYERFEFLCNINITPEEKEMFDAVAKSSPRIKSILLYHLVEGTRVTKHLWEPRENMHSQFTLVPQKADIDIQNPISEYGDNDEIDLGDSGNCVEESTEDGVYYSTTSEMSNGEEDRILSGEIGLEDFMNKRKMKSTAEEAEPRKKRKI